MAYLAGGGHCAYVRPLQSSGKLGLFGLPSSVFTCIGALGTTQPNGAPQTEKKSGGPVLGLTGLSIGRSRHIDITSLMRLTSDQTVANHNVNGHSIDHHDLILLVYHCASCS